MVGLESLFSLSKTKDENLMNFMKNFSIAFQIKNDIDNIVQNGNDIKNGNYTLPMLYFNMGYKDYLLKAKNTMLEYKNNSLKFINNLKQDKYKNILIKITNTILGE